MDVLSRLVLQTASVLFWLKLKIGHSLTDAKHVKQLHGKPVSSSCWEQLQTCSSGPAAPLKPGSPEIRNVYTWASVQHLQGTASTVVRPLPPAGRVCVCVCVCVSTCTHILVRIILSIDLTEWGTYLKCENMRKLSSLFQRLVWRMVLGLELGLGLGIYDLCDR